MKSKALWHGGRSGRGCGVARRPPKHLEGSVKSNV